MASGRTGVRVAGLLLALWLAACGGGSPGTGGTGGLGGAVAGTGGAAGSAGRTGASAGGRGQAGAGGQSGAVAGAGGQAGAGGLAGAQAGAGGQAGSPAGGGVDGGDVDAGACSPCHKLLADVECLPAASATCTSQSSSMTAADGTITQVQNLCFSDGTKNLEVDVFAPGATTPTKTLQILRNGALCSTLETTTSSNADSTGAKVDTTIQTVDDASGDQVATIITVSAPNRATTQTIDCPGHPAAPFSYACVPGLAFFGCAAGSCM